MALTDKLSAIGDAIRAQTGKEEKLTLDQMPDEIAGISGGGGGASAPVLAPLTVTENGTYDANGPIIMTETFTGGTPDLVFDHYGDLLPFFKAQKLVATDAILGAIKAGQVSITADGMDIPVTTSDLMTDPQGNYVYFMMNWTPVVLWLITPNDNFPAEAGFEENSVYVLDVWSAGMLGDGMEASVTALGTPIAPVDGFMPVTVALPLEDELVITPKYFTQLTYKDKYYRKVTVNPPTTTDLTVTPSTQKQIFAEQDNAYYRVEVEAVDMTKLKLLADIYIETMPKTEYQVGEWLSTNGGVLMVQYTDGTYMRHNMSNQDVYGFVTNAETEAKVTDNPGRYPLTVNYTENGITARTSYWITVTGEGDSGDGGSTQPVMLQEKTVTANGVFTPSSGYEGFSKFTVAIPEFDGTVVVS